MNDTPPSPAYRIHTHRLVIRCWDPADAPLLQAATQESYEHLLPWMPWVRDEPEPIETKIARLRRFRSQFDRDENFVYGIFDLEEKRVLGGSGLHPRVGPNALEIGYWIHKDFINQGLATETSAALTRVAFEVNRVRRMEIHCDPRNTRSAAVPRKLGYSLEATLRERFPQSEESWVDSMIWTLFAEQYPHTAAFSAEVQAYDAGNRRIL